MVPLPGVGACVLECYLRFELLVRKRDRDIVLGRESCLEGKSGNLTPTLYALLSLSAGGDKCGSVMECRSVGV